MSLVKCPECGKEISDKALSCPSCGCPIELNPIKPQQVEVTKIKFRSKKVNKKVVISIVVVSILLAGYTLFQKQKAIESYERNINTVAYTMFFSALDAEICGNLIMEVWYNTIFGERDAVTDQYVRPNGYFVDDFNEALQNLFDDESFEEELNSIKESKSTVNRIMKDLKNPPPEYKDAYDALSEFYTAYTEFIELATNPRGNYKEYSNNLGNASTKVANSYNSMQLYLE